MIVVMLLTVMLSISIVTATDTSETTNLTSEIDQTVQTSVDDTLIAQSTDNENNELASASIENQSLALASSNDDVLGDGEGTFSDLYSLISSTPAGGTLTLDKGYYSTGSHIGIYNSITIDGQGNTLDGKDKSRMFYISVNGNVILKNIVFKNGYSNSNAGGAILSTSKIEIINCTFENNHNNYNGGDLMGGGAIHFQNSGSYSTSASVYNSTFKNNYAYKNGGAISTNIANNYVNIYNNSFVGNYVTAGENSKGGGALFSTTASTFNITLCNFTNNSAVKSEGGAIRHSGSIYISDSYFDSNKAGDGAASCNANDNAITNVNNCIFVNNYVSRWGAVFQERNLHVNNSKFINNSANLITVNDDKNGPKAGVIYIRSGYLKVENSEFINNKARYGGVAVLEDRVDQDVNFENCVFEDNSAIKDGGAIYSFTGVPIRVTSSNFINNSAENGGAIAFTVGSYVILNSNFDKNTATVSGGAISAGGSSVSISNSKFNENNAVVSGGAIYGPSCYLNIVSSDFIKNNAGLSGGAVYSKDVSDRSSAYDENTAQNSGGAIYASSTLTSESSSFNKNSAGLGGAVYTPYIGADYVTFSYNNATYGGAVYLDGGTVESSIVSSEFNYNNATEDGGAIYGYLGDISISSSRFVSNYAGSDAGALFWNDGALKVTRGTFRNNKAIKSGGALYINSESSQIRSSIFNSNEAGSHGGAIYVVGKSGMVDDSTFTSNSADKGLDIYWYGNAGTLSNSKFSNPSSDDDVIHWHGSTGVMDTNNFESVKVYVCEHASVYLTGNTQTSTSYDSYSIHSAGHITLNGNDFHNAIYNDGVIESSTFIVILNNSTVITDDSNFDIFTAVLDDNGNYIKLSNGVNNTYENNIYSTTFNNTHYLFKLTNLDLGIHQISASGDYSELEFNTIKSGLLVFMRLDLNVTLINYGETVNVNVTIVNSTTNGTVTITVNDVEYNITINNGTGILPLHSLSPNNYTVVAKYASGIYSISNTTTFTIKLRETNLTITVQNITAGDNETIKINLTNGTTGEVYIFVNGKMYIGKLVNSSTSINLTNVDGGIYNVYAVYPGDTHYLSTYNNSAFTVTKIKPTITINITDRLVGQSVIVNVTATKNITGTIHIYVNDKEYVYTNQSTISFTISNLTAGNYSAKVVYDGDGKYESTANNTTFAINKKELAMTITSTYIKVGQNETIEITVPSDAKGLILVNVNGTNYYVYANNTKAKLTISGLAYGTYNVNATYLEDDLYLIKTVKSTFKVDWENINPQITYTVDDNLNLQVNITVPNDANGDINIEIDGKNYTAHIIKGKASVTISGLNGGEYPAKMYFENDTKYADSTKDFTVQLNKERTRIHIDAPAIFVGDNATITVTVNNGADGSKATDATGKIILKINNNNYTLNVTNGTAVFTISDLAYGNYTVDANYSGDRKYFDDDENEKLIVSKIDIAPYAYITVDSIYVGETATINITMPSDAYGKVNLTIQGNNYNLTITNGTGQIYISGLKYGVPVLIHAEYSGNEKYLPCSRDYTAFAVHRISNYDVDIQATTNETSANITVIIPSDANGPGNITINNKTYAVNFVNGKTNITIGNLTAGAQYEVYAYFGGDDKYTANDAIKTLNSDKTLNYVFDVTAEDITVGEVAILKIYLPNATDGDNITIRVPGRHSITINVHDNITEYPIYDLTAGSYEISVTYLGNEKYDARSRYANISVSKVNKFALNIQVNTPYVGENATFNITVPNDATGNITVRINNKDYNATIVNGTVQINVSGLADGKYNATVYYNGDNKYNERIQTVDVFVLKINEFKFTVDVEDINVGDTETITITLPDDINGNVTITVENTSYVNRNVVINESGIGIVKIPDLTPGKYNVYVSLANDTKYADYTLNRIFTVSTIDDYKFNLTYNESVYVRDNITFTLQLPEDAEGTVNLTIFGKNHTVKVENGIAKLNVTATAEGSFVFTISFEQDGKYNFKSQDGLVTVSKKDVDLNPIYNSTADVDENVTFIVKLPSDATGTISLSTRGVTYSVELKNGTANLTILGYPISSVYSPVLSYSGDDKYNPTTFTSRINVVKVEDYELNVTVENITVEQVEKVNITLPDDATDDVLISGNFTTETISRLISNGKVSLDIGDLPAGTYNITVKYQGYAKYAEKTVTKIFTVSKVVPTIELEFVNDDTINVILPQNANGLANITVGNDIKTQINITNGFGSLNVSNLRPGEYFVNATFLGGVRYLQNNSNITITIPKIKDYTLPISVENITVGETTIITITAPEYATGNINITINNGEVIELLINGGKAIYNVENFKVGNYTVVATYANDEYELRSNSTVFKVDKIKTSISDIINSNATSITINVTLTEGVTGNVTITVDGTPYELKDIKSNKVNLTVPVIPGEHDIVIKYSGDENHTSESITGYVEIRKISDYTILVNATPIITVLDENTVNVTLPKGATGSVHIYVNGRSYPPTEVNSETGIATFTLPTLDSGNYTILVEYSNYLYETKQNTTDFTVIKLNTTVDVEVANITRENAELINITLDSRATGDVLINVNGVRYYETLDGGETTLTLPNLSEGNYTVVITYLGDNLFNTNTTTASFKVSKIPLTIKINTTNIIVGQDAHFTIETSGNITSPVTVTIDGENYTAIVYNGKGNLTVNNLKQGNYNATVTYAGDEYYVACNDSTPFNVTDKILTTVVVEVKDIVVGETVYIYVNVTGASEGSVAIAMLGNPIIQELENGQSVFVYNNLTPRDYHFTAYYIQNEIYAGSNTTGDFKVLKKNATLDINVDNIYVGEDANVTVTISEGATGYVLLNINGTQYYAAINGTTFNVTIPDLSIGNYTVTATYLGDDNYNGNVSSDSFNVTKLTTGITITSDDEIIVGHPVVFTIETTAEITEVVTITIGDNNYTTFVENGKGSFSVYDLPVGNYIAYVYFPGNSQYGAERNFTKFNVIGKKASSITVNVSNITVGESVTIYANVTEGASGIVTFIVAGDAYNKDVVNGKAYLTLSNLTARDYHVTAYYRGDDNYLISNSTANFTVSKKDAIIKVFTQNSHVGDVDVINVTVPDDATGHILIIVGGMHVYAEINGSSNLSVSLTELELGTYNVTVEYVGDAQYNAAYANASFNVSKYETTINITSNANVIVVGQPVTFTIETSANITEVITIKIGDNNYTTFVENGKGTYTVYGLESGDYTAYVYFPGNSRYDANDNFTNFKVSGKSKVNITFTVSDITVGDDAVIRVVVNVTGGNVTLAMAGNPQTLPVINGTVNFTVPSLTARDYHFTLIYLENDDYLSANITGDFKVNKKTSSINVSVSDITVGEDAIVKINVTEGATGIVLISFDGIHIYTEINESSFTVSIPDLGLGNYNLTVTYLGDDNYNGSSDNDSFNVTKLKTTIIITGSDIVVGHPEVFTIETSANITEVITIKIGDNNYTTFVENGKGTFSVYDLTEGNYTAYVYFPGNSKYDENDNLTKFKVTGKKPSAVTVNVSSITVGESVIIYANVTENATGIISFVVAGEAYNRPIVNGKANLTLSNLTARDYHVTAYYRGDDNYLISNNTAEFTVSKKNTQITVNVTNSTVGSVEYINVTLNENATGNVLLSVNGSHYYGILENGIAKFNVTGLLVGNYTVNVTYLGDDKYNAVNTTVNITITKIITLINITGTTIIVGADETLTIQTSESITSLVTIEIEGVGNYTTFISNGKGSLVLRDLEPNTYTATVYYEGSDIYLPRNNSTQFTVKGKSQSEITIKADSITVGNDAVIYVNVTEGATGKVTITVGGNTYTKDLNDGKVNFTVPDLSARDYNINAYYLGDDNYSVSNSTAVLTVNKVPTSISFEVSDINVGQKAVIKVILNESTRDNITVHVNGVKYILKDYNDTIEVKDLPEGTVVVSAVFDGNEILEHASNETTFKVSKNSTKITVISHNIDVGQKETIEIHMAADIDGVVEVKVGEISYAAVVKDGVAKLELKDLKQGDYNINVTFYGNTKYYNATGNGSFVVSLVNAYDLNADAIVHDDLSVTINVTLPNDANGKFNVTIEGKNYTGDVVNGKGTITIPNLLGKEYIATVTYAGDDKYNTSSKDIVFALGKLAPNMQVNYTSINVGETAQITVTIAENASGNITLTINGNNYNKTIENGKVVFEVPGLSQALYPFTVSYAGDDRYLPDQYDSELSVNKVSDYKLTINTTDIYVGDVAVINITLPDDINGIVKIKVNDENYSVTITNGFGSVEIPDLSKGEYVIEAEFEGDDKYGYLSDNGHINVRRISNYDLNVTIDPKGAEVGQNTTITVTLPDDVTGKVNITVNNKTSLVDVVNGVAKLNATVETGDNPVIITYPGDDKYESQSTTTDLSGTKITNYDFTVQGDNIHYGEIAYIRYQLPEDAYLNNATITFAVESRQVLTLQVNTNGTGFAIYADLPVGVYNASVTYNGNDKYAASTRYGHLVVTKVSDYDMGVIVNEPEVGENLTFVITLPEDAGGNLTVTIVTVEIGNKTYNATVINGTAVLNISTDELPEGDYDAIVHYSGDEKYDNITKIVHVDIVKIDKFTFDIETANIHVGENETINITLPGDVNGEVILNISGKIHTVTITNGTGSINITDLTHGTYDVKAEFRGDSKYSSETKYATFTVSQVSDYKFEIDYNDTIKVGQNATVTVELPEDVKGNVTLTIDNKEFQAQIQNGKAIVNATGLLDGAYQFTVSFSDENGKYASDSKIGMIVVSKTDIEIKPVYDNITVGEDAKFNITLPADITGNLTLLIDGKTYTEEIKNGNVTFIIPDLDADNHTFIISYDGDDKYNSNVYTGTIKTGKDDSYEWDFNVTDIKVGENEIINITLPSDATGNVLINVNGNGYYAPIKNGNATYTLTGLANDTYTVTVEYLGNGKYTNKTLTKTFKVFKNTIPISIDINKNIITVTVPNDATGNITIEVGSKKENVSIINGKATLDISELLPGPYTVNAEYAGDNKYVANNTSEPIEITKVDDYDLTVSVKNITAGENAIIIVTLPSDATGNVSISINDGEIQNATIANGKARLEVPNLTVGNYTVKVSYENAKFDLKTNETKFTVSKIKSDDLINVEITDENITVTLPENATGNITVIIDGKNYTVINNTETNPTVIPLENITPGQHNITVIYSGDNNYTESQYNESVILPKEASTIKITPKDITQGDTETILIEVTPGATGIVLVKVNGTGYYVELNESKATLNITGLSKGNYTINATYLGDDNYLESTNDTEKFEVSKVTDTPISVKVENITIGENTVVKVTVPEDAAGNVTVTIGNITKIVPVAGGENEIIVPGVPVGEHDVTVTYNGDDKYEPNTNTTKVNVKPVETSPDDVKVEDLGNGTVIVTVSENATGNITIKLGNDTYNATIVNGSAVIDLVNATPGENNITVIYSGDKNNTGVEYNTTVNRNKYSTPISIDVEDSVVGNVTQITVNVPEDASENVTIEIDGKSYTNSTVDGKAVFNIPGLSAGDKSVIAVYAGDKNYVANSTTANFTVNKVKSNVTVKVDNINVGDKAIINITGPKDVNGLVIVTVDGVNYSVTLTNGTGSVEIAKLSDGNYDVEVTYIENDKYLTSNATDSFKVSKVEDANVNVSVENTTVDQPVKVTISVPEDAAGNVTVTIGNVSVTVPVTGGENIVSVPGVPVGEHDVTVTYNGDDKYEPNTNTTKVNVKPVETSPEDVKVEDLGNGTVIVTVPENATGNITIKLGNDTYNATIVNGSAVIDLVNATPGENNITVIYSGDENNTGVEFNTTVSKDKYSTPISIDVEDSVVGNVTQITVNVPEDASENVTIEIDGKSYTNATNKGKAVFNIAGLGAGDKSVIAVYAGDKNYVANSTTANFTVNKVKSNVTVKVDNINVGDKAIITVTGPEDIEGNVIVTVDGVNYSVTLTNGTGSVEIAKLSDGNYDVGVTYIENDKYLTSNATDSFKVSKVEDANISVSVENTTVDQPVEVLVTLPEDATGNVTVTVGNITKTVPVTGGDNVISVPGVPVGEHDVVVTYNGDDKYEPVTNTTKVNVEPKNTTPSDVKVEDLGNGTVKVTVPDNATGNITIKVGNDTVTAEIINGTATIDLDNVTPGVNNITVIYSGDENNTGVEFNTTINVISKDTPISIDVSDINVGDVAEITVTVPNDATGEVTIEIEGKTYTAKANDGKAIFKVSDLTDGNKTVSAVYAGDKNYLFNSTTATFKVSKVKSTVNITVEDINVGENATITVNGPSDIDGYAVVTVDGINYSVALTNGKGTLTIPKLAAGEYDVEVTYLENDKYLNSTNKDSFKVSKVEDVNINVSADNATVDKPVEVVVNVPDDATGNVTVTVGNVTVTVPVAGGENVISVPGVPVGEHDVVVTYNGDDKYEPVTNTTKVNVEPVKTAPEDVKVEDLGNGTVKVTVPDNATGNITIKVGNDTVTAEIINGTATVDLSNASGLKPGANNITVIYSGDKNHACVATGATVNVPKADPTIKLEVNSIKVGEDEIITITVPDDATGVVLVDIDGVGYYANITDGKATLTISGLKPGNYTVVATYPGDDKYNNVSTADSFKVDSDTPSSRIGTYIEVDPNFTRVANDFYKAGERGDMFYGVLKDTNGNVLPNKIVQITVNGAVYNVTTDSQGRAGLQINLVSANVYTYALFFQGDDTYDASPLASSRLTVTKKATSITASAKTFKATAKTKKITVTLKTSKNPYDGKTYLAKGKVIKLTINGKTYTAKTNAKNKATFKIKITKKGTYTGKLKFKGTKTYAESSKSIKVTIK